PAKSRAWPCHPGRRVARHAQKEGLARSRATAARHRGNHQTRDAKLMNAQKNETATIITMTPNIPPQCLRARLRRYATHEPTHPWSLPGGELLVWARRPAPLLGGVGGGFMVPMRDQNVVEAHEPLVRSSAFTRSGPPEGETPNPLLRWFMAPTHVKTLEVFPLHEPHPLIPSFSPSGGEGA